MKKTDEKVGIQITMLACRHITHVCYLFKQTGQGRMFLTTEVRNVISVKRFFTKIYPAAHIPTASSDSFPLSIALGCSVFAVLARHILSYYILSPSSEKRW